MEMVKGVGSRLTNRINNWWMGLRHLLYAWMVTCYLTIQAYRKHWKRCCARPITTWTKYGLVVPLRWDLSWSYDHGFGREAVALAQTHLSYQSCELMLFVLDGISIPRLVFTDSRRTHWPNTRHLVSQIDRAERSTQQVMAIVDQRLYLCQNQILWRRLLSAMVHSGDPTMEKVFLDLHAQSRGVPTNPSFSCPQLPTQPSAMAVFANTLLEYQTEPSASERRALREIQKHSKLAKLMENYHVRFALLVVSTDPFQYLYPPQDSDEDSNNNNNLHVQILCRDASARLAPLAEGAIIQSNLAEISKQPEVVSKQPEVVSKQPEVVFKQPEVVSKQQFDNKQAASSQLHPRIAALENPTP